MTNTYLSAFAWIADNHAKVDPPIRVVNMSFGGAPQRYTPGGSIIWRAQEALVARGITVVAAAGNSGGDGTQALTTDGCVNTTPGIICVANYDDAQTGTREGSLAASSSRGAAGDAGSWPDISAPGTGITSTCRLTLWQYVTHGSPVQDPPNLYSSASGTSIAAPHVTGIVTQVLQALPSLTPAEVEHLLEATAYKFDGGGGGYVEDPLHPGGMSSFDKGHGLVDALAAVEAALELAAQR